MCTIGALTTVYSYILQRNGDEMTLHVANGLPCTARWSELPLPLGARWTDERARGFLSSYPGGPHDPDASSGMATMFDPH